MKRAAKVFIWIGMIFNFYLIYPIVIGVLALKKLKTASSKNELQTLGILTLLFCNLIGGVFMLCMTDEELATNVQDSDKKENATTASKIETELKDIKRLYDEQLITDEEYNRMRAAVIARICAGESEKEEQPAEEVATTESTASDDDIKDDIKKEETVADEGEGADDNEPDDDFGLVPQNPIYVNGIDEQEKYLNSLYTSDGESIYWNRRGSMGVDGVDGLVDIYDTFLPSGEEYKTIYINMYGEENSTSAPGGFYLDITEDNSGKPLGFFKKIGTFIKNHKIGFFATLGVLVLSLVISLFACIGRVFPAVSDGFKYKVNNARECTIVGIVEADAEIVIPSTIKGMKVTSIGDYAFSDCDQLISIYIPDGVTSIGERAFDDCDRLTRINIPSNVKSIGDSAFRSCNCLTSITIPHGVTSIGISTFKYCSSLVSITIPNSVTSIDDYAFQNCYSLTSVVFGTNSKLTSIGEHAFSECTSLRSITIPNSVTSLGDYAFSSCEKLTSITIPHGVKSIGDSAFDCCFDLASISMPDNVMYIGSYAFQNCHSLTSITFGGTMTQWREIGKDSGWNYNANKFIVYCTDGTITYSK